MKKLLIAGATGGLGIACVQAAKAAGWWVRGTGRRIERIQSLADECVSADVLAPGALDGIAGGIDAVLSCLGAPLSLSVPDRQSPFEIDTEGNRRILDQARRSSVRRFVYVSMHLGDGYRHTAYVRAHEQFVAMLRQSGISCTVIRPTGIFWALAEMLDFARKGVIPVTQGGTARTNPVHEADVAKVCIEALDGGPDEIGVGGPEILTRKQIAEHMFRAIGKPPRTVSIPSTAFRLIGKLQSVGNPRKRELFEFFAAVTTADCVAPAIGKRTLADYLAERAKIKPR